MERKLEHVVKFTFIIISYVLQLKTVTELIEFSTFAAFYRVPLTYAGPTVAAAMQRCQPSASLVVLFVLSLDRDWFITLGS